jgi:hypothetical protein
MKVKKFISRYLSYDRYFSSADFSRFSLDVLEYRKIRISDRHDTKYEAWSRIYEYPLVLDKIREHTASTDISIHNSSWGFNSCHIDFKNDLESEFSEIVNSDLLPSDVPNTVIWDITSPPPAAYLDKFDFVLNVSTVEEVDADHLMIIENLVSQIKPGGLLVMTFDMPGMQLKKLNKLVNQELVEFDDNLNGANSVLPTAKYSGLNCGLLVLRRKS